MKLKYAIACLMLLVLAFGIAAISAEDATVGDYTFAIPEGFEIINESDEGISLSGIDTSTINVGVLKQKMGNKEIIKSLKAQGYELDDKVDGTYDMENFKVSRYVFTYKDAYYGYCYICDDGDDQILIYHYFVYEDDLDTYSDDSDVFDIIQSLEKK